MASSHKSRFTSRKNLDEIELCKYPGLQLVPAEEYTNDECANAAPADACANAAAADECKNDEGKQNRETPSEEASTSDAQSESRGKKEAHVRPRPTPVAEKLKEMKWLKTCKRRAEVPGEKDGRFNLGAWLAQGVTDKPVGQCGRFEIRALKKLELAAVPRPYPRIKVNKSVMLSEKTKKDYQVWANSVIPTAIDPEAHERGHRFHLFCQRLRTRLGNERDRHLEAGETLLRVYAKMRIEKRMLRRY
jgi:hypothetical protein